MTVEAQVPFNSYIAAPGATVFTYEFKIIASADLVATIDGGTPLEIGVDYSLTGVGANDGGNLTLFAPLAGGEAVLLKRQMTFDRETDYQQNGDYQAAVVNNDFDRLWLAMRQVDQLLLSSIKVPFAEESDQTLNLSPAARANKALVFDDAGSISVSDDNYVDQLADVTAQAAIATAQAVISTSQASTAITSAASAQVDAGAAALSASQALYYAQHGTGFTESTAYDFGTVADSLTLFPLDFGAIA